MEWDTLEDDIKHIEMEYINISEFSKYKYSNVDLDDRPKTNAEGTPPLKLTNVVLMNYRDFNADLYKSFKYNSQRILSLFKTDVPRETLIINGVQYSNPKKAFKEINKITINGEKIMRWRKMLYMLSTQAVMYIPCYLLTRSYCNDIYYLGETRERHSMIVDIKGDSVDISKVLRIFYVNSHEDVTLYKVSFQIHVEYEKCVILSWKIDE